MKERKPLVPFEFLSASLKTSEEILIEKIQPVVMQKTELGNRDERKLGAHFGLFGLSGLRVTEQNFSFSKR